MTPRLSLNLTLNLLLQNLHYKNILSFSHMKAIKPKKLELNIFFFTSELLLEF